MCLPNLRGNGGPMLCLNSAYCNETLGGCQGCPTGFLNDELLFQANINCGLGRTWIIPIYIVTSIFAFFFHFNSCCWITKEKEQHAFTLASLEVLVDFSSCSHITSMDLNLVTHPLLLFTLYYAVQIFKLLYENTTSLFSFAW